MTEARQKGVRTSWCHLRKALERANQSSERESRSISTVKELRKVKERTLSGSVKALKVWSCAHWANCGDGFRGVCIPELLTLYSMTQPSLLNPCRC